MKRSDPAIVQGAGLAISLRRNSLRQNSLRHNNSARQLRAGNGAACTEQGYYNQHANERYELQARSNASEYIKNHWNSLQGRRSEHPAGNATSYGYSPASPTALSRGLISAPAASYHAPDSRPELLDVSVRQFFEQAFHADFSRVKIHRDAAAREAARKQRAKAFAAGTHIYFATGMYRPDTKQGQALLAHELTHILQQTGRRSSSGRLVAVDKQGPAPVQREPDDLVETLASARVFEEPYTWAHVKRIYSGVSGIASHIQAIENHAPQAPASGPPDYAAIKNDLDRLGTGTPAEIRGLYIDALKTFGAWEEAATALIENSDVPTAFRSRELYEAVHQGGVAWLPPYVSEHPFLSTYYPNRMVDAYRTYFFMYSSRNEEPVDIHRDYLPPGTDRSAEGSFWEEVGDEIRRTSATRPIRNELEMAALFAMRELDRGRREWLPATLRVVREAHPGDSWRTWVSGTAQRFTQPREDNLQLGADETEVVALFDQIYPAIQEAATHAVAYWTRSARLTEAVMANTAFESYSTAELAAIAAELRTDRVTSGLSGQLSQLGQVLFARNGNEADGYTLPSAATFARRVEQARTRIQHQLRRIGLHLADLARGGRETTSRGLVLGLAIGVLTRVDRQLLRYDTAMDAEFESEGRSDMRTATRIWVAEVLRDIGVRLGMDTVRNAGNAVFLEGVHLAILDRRTDKEDHTHSTYEQMRRDLTDSEGHWTAIGTWSRAGITPWHLWAYSNIGFWNQFTRTLHQIVEARSGDSTIREQTSVNEAFETVGRSSRPRRYTLQQMVYANPGMATGVGTIGFIEGWSFELAHNAAYQSVLNLAGPGEVLIAPDEYPGGNMISLWIFPRMDVLARRLSRIPGLAEDVRLHFEATHSNQSAPSPDDWLDWLNALGEMAGQLSPEELERLQGSVTSAVRGDYQRATDAAEAEGRRATTQLRRRFVERFTTMLDGYDRGGRDRWTVPDVLLHDIQTFASAVWPASDKRIQVAALILEIAPQLESAFGVNEGIIDTPVIQRVAIADALLTLAWGARREFAAAKRERDVRQAAQGPDHPFIEPPLFQILSIGFDGAQLYETLYLSHLQQELTAYALERQRRSGLSADPDRGLASVYILEEGWTIIRMGMRTEWIPVDTPFRLYGVQYELKQVNQRFTFHEAFGARETLGIDWGGGRRPGDPLLLDSDGDPLPTSGRVLVVYQRTPNNGQGQTETIEVRDNDPGALDELRRITVDWFSFEYLGGAGVVIQTMGQAELIAFEAIFPEISAAEFVATVLQVASSPEITDLLDAIREQGFGAFDEIFHALASVVDFDELGNTLLFDADFRSSTRSNSRIQPRSTAGAERARTRGGVWARLGQILANIFRIGLKVLDALKRLVKYVQVPVREVQLFTMRKPVVLMLLDFMMLAWDILSSVDLDDLEEMLQGLQEGNWRDRLRLELREGLQELLNQGQEIFDALRHLEMPEELIANELVVDAIMDLVVDLLRGKYHAGAITLRGLLRTVGLWDRITREIADQLLVGGLDPNVHYRNTLRARINPWFTDVRDQFVQTLESKFEEVPFISGLAAPPGTPIDIGSAMSGFGFDLMPRQEPRPAAGLQDPVAVNTGGGSPLHPAVRSGAELAFGHDFGHVRMHTGAEGERVTSQLNAHGATLGSHIWMPSSLSPGGASSKPVLFHELAHVIQQTGPRPLDTPQDRRPVNQFTSRRLNFDPQREASADRAAAMATSRPVSTHPIDVGGASSGVQPAFTAQFIRTFIRHLGEREDLAQVREENAHAGNVTLDSDSNAIVQAVTSALQAAISRQSTHFRSPFDRVRSALVTLIQNRWTEIQRAIPRIASLAIFPVRPAGVRGDASQRAAARVPWLNPEAFKTEIERELYAVTGLAMVFDFHTLDGTGPLARKTIIDTTSPLRSVSFVHLDLPLLDAMGTDADSEALWDALITNTFGSGGSLAAAELQAYKGAAKIVLGRTTSRYGLYQRRHFKLSNGKARVVRNQRERIDTLIAGDWPTPQQYVQTDPSASSLPASVKHIGLRLETYATKVSVTDRDAHHTVQYLLFEYLRNGKTLKPFRHIAQGVPGVHATSSGEVNTIDDGAGHSIDVNTYYPGRGGAMPTISLSKNTHLSGVHFRSERPDDGSPPRSSQGAAVHNTFSSKVGSYFWQVLDTPAQLTELQQRQQARQLNADIRSNVRSGEQPITVNRVRQAVFHAAQQTYQEMWNDMRSKLESHLGTNEVDYYNQVAMRKGMADRIDRDTMTSTFQDIVDRTENVIGRVFHV